eukprot:3198974-Pyramimonas_sp.AAC.1
MAGTAPLLTAGVAANCLSAAGADAKSIALVAAAPRCGVNVLEASGSPENVAGDMQDQAVRDL